MTANPLSLAEVTDSHAKGCHSYDRFLRGRAHTHCRGGHRCYCTESEHLVVRRSLVASSCHHLRRGCCLHAYLRGCRWVLLAARKKVQVALHARKPQVYAPAAFANCNSAMLSRRQLRCQLPRMKLYEPPVATLLSNYTARVVARSYPSAVRTSLVRISYTAVLVEARIGAPAAAAAAAAVVVGAAHIPAAAARSLVADIGIRH